MESEAVPATRCKKRRRGSFIVLPSQQNLVRRRKAGRDAPTQLNARECSPTDSTCAAARIARLRHTPLGSPNIRLPHAHAFAEGATSGVGTTRTSRDVRSYVGSWGVKRKCCSRDQFDVNDPEPT